MSRSSADIHNEIEALAAGLGKLTGDRKLEAEGNVEKAEGKARSFVGGVKDALRGK